MAFSDDMQVLKTRADTLRTDMDATLMQLATALYNRLRPLPAIDWMTDAVLLQACQAFAGVAMRSVIPPAPMP